MKLNLRRATIFLTLLVAPDLALAQTTELVSVSTAGRQGDALSGVPSISADGRYVAFGSESSTLVAGDSNGTSDIFVRDRLTSTTLLVSRTPLGTSGNGYSYVDQDSISADGRFVTFLSVAADLVPGDTNGVEDVFVRDLIAGTTANLSMNPVGAMTNTDTPISQDGRYVAFSRFDGLVAGDSNGATDVFVHDRRTGATQCASVDSSGADANSSSGSPSLSSDGRYVAFLSLATNLVTGDTNDGADIFVHDMLSGFTRRVSVDSAGVEANAACVKPSISADGRYVGFSSEATNLVAGDTNGKNDDFVHDLRTGKTTRISIASNGSEGDWHALHTQALSDGGRFVAFSSYASNLASSDTLSGDPFGHDADCFVHDRLTGVTSLISVNASGVAGNKSSIGPCAMSAGTRFIAFRSDATNLVPVDVNGCGDVFVHDRGAIPATAFCFGDASTAACPCANTGAIGHGCANSSFAVGGILSAAGSASIAADTMTLSGASMSGSLSIYFQGTGTASNLFDDGRSCLSGSLIRVGSKAVVGGVSSNPSGAGDAPLSIKGAIPPSGGTRYYQVAYRDLAPGFCTSAQTNRTNGMALVWAP